MEKPSEKGQESPGFSEFKTQGTVPRPRGKLVAEPRLVLGPRILPQPWAPPPSSNVTGVEREERREFLA